MELRIRVNQDIAGLRFAKRRTLSQLSPITEPSGTQSALLNAMSLSTLANGSSCLAYGTRLFLCVPGLPTDCWAYG